MIILRKRAADGPFELYTDPESMIEHYTKIRRMFKAVTILELVGFFIEIGCGMEGNMFGWAFARSYCSAGSCMYKCGDPDE